MLTGYHFTAYHNWPSIQKHGLGTRRLTADTVRRLTLKYADTLDGSWVFREPPTDDSDLLGQLVFTMMDHTTHTVAFVRCLYRKSESLCEAICAKGDIPDLTHTGWWAIDREQGERKWDYHVDKPFDIVLANLPPERLSLIAVYGIQEIGNGD